MIKDLDDFKAYQLAMEMGEKVWEVTKYWSHFEKDTVGRQLVRAADSIAANLSEGLGRYYFKETKNFAYYSRGSLFETKTWLNKASSRGLISKELFSELLSSIEILGKMINGYINSVDNLSKSH